MKNLLFRAGALALALLPSLAFAQTVGSSVQFPNGWAPGTSICVQQSDKTCPPVSATTPLPVMSDSSTPFYVTPTDGTAVPSATLSGVGTLMTVDTAGYRGLAFTLNGPSGQANVAFECSNDSATGWTGCGAAQVATGGYTASTATTGTPFYLPAVSRYVRLRLSTWTSGSWTATAFLKQTNMDPGQTILGTGGAVIGRVVFGTDATSNASAPSVVSSTLTGGLVLKAAPGNLFGLNVASTSVAGYVLVLNTTTIPLDGAVVPLKCYYLAASSSLDLDRAIPINGTAGLVVVFSTTGCFTKTISATAFISGDVR